MDKSCQLDNTRNNIVKRRSGEKLESKEKQIIFNVFNYLRSKNPERSVSRTVEDTAEATGCSTQTVFRIRKEATSGAFRSPSKTKPRKNINKNSRLIKYDDFVRSSIRGKVHDCLFKNLPVSLNTVLSTVNADPDLPNFKRSTLHKVLNEMGFTYEKKGKFSMYIENADLINSRHSYLKDVRRFRIERRTIIYTGETVIEASNPGSKTNEGAMHFDLFADVNSTAIESNKSLMYTVIQAGNENGFLKDGDLIFVDDKKQILEDDGSARSRFEDWVKNSLLANLPPSSIIVVDNSSHHRWKSDPFPDKTWQRDKIKEWLISKRIAFKDEFLKKELLDVVATVKLNKSFGFQMEEIVASCGHTVVKLPPHHWDLSPLGHVWPQVKQYIALHSALLKPEDFQPIIWEALRCVGLDSWRTQMETVLKVEENMWRADMLQETIGKEVLNATVSASSDVVSTPTKPAETVDSTDRAHWFNDFMRLRTRGGYQQYYGDQQQGNFDMVK